jgi:ADP-heptose:LPS heptosyltransferase
VRHSYLELAHDIVGVPYDFGRLFFPTHAERLHAADFRRWISSSKKIAGWCITGTRVDKIYPQTPVAIARMIRELDIYVVLVGAPAPALDFQIAKEVQEKVRAQNGTDEGLHLAPSLEAQNPASPIRSLLAFLLVCDLVVGPDTGPMWSVAFEPMAKIMLHSHASVENITKHWVNTVSLHADHERVPCWPCHKLHDSMTTCVPNRSNNGAACITDISVQSVLSAASRLLARS